MTVILGKPANGMPGLIFCQHACLPTATAGVYSFSVDRATPIGPAGVAKALADPFFRGASQMVATVATIDVGKVIGPAMAEAICALGPPVPPAVQSFNAFVNVQRLSSVLYTPDIRETRESLPFFIETPAGALEQEMVTHHQPELNAVRAFKKLGEWLGVGDEDIAGAVGIGRTTVYSWQRENREPRRGTAQRLYEYHAVLSALRRRLGPEGLTLWLSAGEPSHRDLLLKGDLESVEGAVDTQLFVGQGAGPDLAWRGEDFGRAVGYLSTDPPRPSRRKARRARLN
jgi:hypothetical protein